MTKYLFSFFPFEPYSTILYLYEKKKNKPTEEVREDVDMVDGENENDEEGEVPMLHLASFALHKLFSEWQSEGYEIPDFKIGSATLPLEAMVVDKPQSVPGVPPKRNQLPENAHDMHPTTLLCMVISNSISIKVPKINAFNPTFLSLNRCVQLQNMLIWAVKAKFRIFYIALVSKSMGITSLEQLKIRNWLASMQLSMHATKCLALILSKTIHKMLSQSLTLAPGSKIMRQCIISYLLIQ